MGDIHYMTAEEFKVEAKEVKQWEERLLIDLGTTKKGHHYYTKEDIRLIECIARLSKAGVTDEELKEMIPEMLSAKCKNIELRGTAVASDKITTNMSEVNMAVIMERALQNNNVLLEQGICDMVTESLKKEITYLLLAKDQVEEERFKRLDTLIRQQQINRKENGKKSMGFFCREKLGFV